MKKVHLIATGGSVMHNIALALHGMGYQVSGSDDQIYEPARSRLSEAGILPQKEGWYPDRISRDLDAVILGMHAKSDNPELGRARELGVPIYSFPEFVGLQYQHKRQIVVIGSHGKTTTTSMLMHVFKSLGLSFDYLVGAQLEGFQNMVSFSDAPLAIIEGDEYLSSCLDAQPKFMHYHPFVTIVTGVAWDHYNVFPTYESYLKAFTDRIESLEIGHHIVYYQEDAALCEIIDHHGSHLVQHPYDTALHE
ncbi:MAG TPA: Mur ligase domain-containing protein, partial [Saprospiraceae bacterium]|nr:Mur ligase domain-containing protein [Saprospiraceae bacterium]